MVTIFTLVNSFTCFFLKKLNNFVGFITLGYEKPGACSRFSRPSSVS